MSPRRAAVLVLLACALTGVRAEAQVSEADRATARALAQKGQEALEAKDFRTAAEAFEKANSIIRAPTLLFGLASAQIGLGKWVRARELLEQIVREGAPKGSPPSWSAAVKDAEQELAALGPRIPKLVVTVAGAPSAELKIDGVVVPGTPGAARPIDPGPHTLRAEAAGFQPAESTVTLAEGRTETVVLTLAPLAAAPSPSKMPLQKVLGFASIGVGGAGLVVGVATGVAAIGKHASLADLCPNGRCKGQQAAIDSYNAMGNASTAMFVIGTAFAAAGVTLVLTAPKPRAEGGAAWITPVLGPGSVGVQGGF